MLQRRRIKSKLLVVSDQQSYCQRTYFILEAGTKIYLVFFHDKASSVKLLYPYTYFSKLSHSLAQNSKK